MNVSIKTRIIVAVLGCMLGVAAAANVLVGISASYNMRIASEQAMASAGAALAAMERADIEKLDATLVGLMAHPGLAAAFAHRHRVKLLELAAPVFAELKRQHDVTHWYFLDPEPACTYFLRVHKPEQAGDVAGGATLAAAMSSRGRGAGKELGKTAFALRVVRPYVAGGRLLGYMGLGEEIDGFLGRMRTQTGDDYGLLLQKEFLDRKAWANAMAGRRDNWDDFSDVVLVNTTADASIVDVAAKLQAVPDSGRLLDEQHRAGRTFVRGIVPVTDAAGRRVGGLFVQHDITALHISMARARTAIIGTVAAVAVFLAVLLVWLTQHLVFARLHRMMETMEDLLARLAGGDYAVAQDMKPSGDDEIGRFELFVGQFLHVIESLLKALTEQKAG
jgi:hypothetical protein